MKDGRIQEFRERIQALNIDNQPIFGQMNAHQMLVHCADQLRLAKGEIETEFGKLDPSEVIALAKAGKTVQAPKGLDQVKGEGTQLTSFENDKELLIELIKEFQALPDDFVFTDHPYLGKKDKVGWSKLVVYHLNHHLTQFRM